MNNYDTALLIIATINVLLLAVIIISQLHLRSERIALIGLMKKESVAFNTLLGLGWKVRLINPNQSNLNVDFEKPDFSGGQSFSPGKTWEKPKPPGDK